ncbi:MAG: holo-ACP synthase [Chloroflexi bacterium]|nr:holo-ACP synthase [Chloroflexota bacterium]
MVSSGVDIIEISRVKKALSRWGERFLLRVFTPDELRLCHGRMPELAVRFAGKEAVSKALGTGMRGVAWREIEILSDPRGKPIVHLHNRAKMRAEEISLNTFAISLSHTDDLAIAFVVATT